MKRPSLLSKLVKLQSSDVHRLISEKLSHLLSNAIAGYSCDWQTIRDMVVKASVTGSAIEGSCNSLETAPSGMTVRGYLNNELCVTQLPEIERKNQLQHQADLPRRL